MGRLEERIFTLTGDRVGTQRPLKGGDLSDVALVTLQSGARLVAKTGPMVDREGRMLTAIANTGAPAPRVIATQGDLLLLEALEETRPGAGSWQTAGAALATLHAATGDTYGWDEDYAFGTVAIANTPRDDRHHDGPQDWPNFWATNRLLCHADHLPGDLPSRLATLCETLPSILPKAPRPALLHGDLWSGNLLFGPAPEVSFIDPACYHGDPEVDLAMLHLFGQPGPGFAETYGPLQGGWEERRAVYTLWPALVHLRLFGSGYSALVDRLLKSLGA